MKCVECIINNPKRFVIINYIILLIYGFGLLAWGLSEKNRATHTENIVNFAIWISVGVVSILNAAMGLYGTYNDDKCLVYTSIVLLFTTCCAQILVTVVRITMPYKGSAAHKKELENIFRKSEGEVEEFSKKEREMQCCGVNDYNDYERKFDPFIIGYPSSCCSDLAHPCQNPYKIGCHEKLMNNLRYIEMIRASIFLFSSAFKFISAIVISILTIWGDDLTREPVRVRRQW